MQPFGSKITSRDIKKHLAKDFQKVKSIVPIRFWRYCISYLMCCCRKRDPLTARYKDLMAKSESMLSKEMDLKKFILRQRLNTMSNLAALTGKQSSFVDKMSQLVIRESEDDKYTSIDSEIEASD